MPGDNQDSGSIPSASEVRIKQLENELAARDRLSGAAEREISRVWEAYSKAAKVIGWVILAGAALATFLGIKTYQDIKDLARKAAQAEVEAVRPQIRERLDREFASTNIQKLITEKASERIDATAGPLVAALITTNVTPLMATASNQVEQLKAEISKVRQESDVYQLIAEAQADDRAAFWQLWTIGNDANNPLKSLARSASLAILEGISYQGVLSRTFQSNADPWIGSNNSAEKASFHEYLLQFSQLSKPYGIVLVRQLWNQQRFPLDKRLRFLVWILKYHNSIALQAEAINLLDTEAKIGKNVLGVNEYIEWYEKRANRKVEERMSQNEF